MTYAEVLKCYIFLFHFEALLANRGRTAALKKKIINIRRFLQNLAEYKEVNHRLEVNDVIMNKSLAFSGA
jgi:hypothetical protein